MYRDSLFSFVFVMKILELSNGFDRNGYIKYDLFLKYDYVEVEIIV